MHAASRKIGKLARKRPENLTGLNMFVRDAVALASAKRCKLTIACRRQVVARSGSEYVRLSGPQKQAYDQRAAIEAVAKREELEHELASLK